MNKTSIKNFAIWARNKLIADISYRAGLMGITDKGIKDPLPQSNREMQFFDIGTAEPYAISGSAIRQREKLVVAIEQKAKSEKYEIAYRNVMEEVAYTWFNRLIAIRFMEINDYMPAHVRVLSSVSGKMEPDIVTTPFDAELDFTEAERQTVIALKTDNQLDELFRLLFLKQCNALNAYLPALFEKTEDCTELLLNLSVVDQDGVVYHLVHDIDEADFDISQGGQVEIIGWLYQYYNTEPKAKAFAQKEKIRKDQIPAVTQLFTPDWIVRYMVENSLGRLWVEGHPANEDIKSNWKYYLEEAEQESEVQAQLAEIRKEYARLSPENIRVIDPCMGSGHILVYCFDVLMQIYEAAGYSQRDAAKLILEHNIYGLDIDDRAFQLAYFALMMKARQYNRRILNAETVYHVHSICESNGIDRNHLKYFGAGLSEIEKNSALNQVQGLIGVLQDAKEYGSILNIENYDWELLRRFAANENTDAQMSLGTYGIEKTQGLLKNMIEVGETLAQKYHVVVTNPPYMNSSGMSIKLSSWVKLEYQNSKEDLYSVFIEKVIEMLSEFGISGLMTSYTWMYLATYEKFRNTFLRKCIIQSLVQLEYHAFFESANVPICTFVIRKGCIDYIGSYIKLSDFYGAEKQSIYYLKAVADEECAYLFKAQHSDFLKIPRSSIAYWLKKDTISLFGKELLADFSDLKQGLITGNNDKFLRLWQECSIDKITRDVTNLKKWFFYHKGGDYRKWYGNIKLVVNWEDNGYDIINFKDANGKQRSRPQNIRYYLREGFTWTALTVADFNVRYMPKGAIFDAKGSAGFCKNPSSLFYIIGLCNSKVVMEFLSFLAPTMDYSAGAVAKIPTIMSNNYKEKINEIVLRNIDISKSDWDSFETSWEFQCHPLLPSKEEMEYLTDGYPSDAP